MENQSVLKFTYEIGYDKLPFFDVSIKINNDHFQTSVFKKLTNTGDLLNYVSECPDRYKTGVINTMSLRADKISSSFEIFSSELERIRQVFVNNNYPMKVIEECINNFFNKLNTNNNNNLENKQAIKLY